MAVETFSLVNLKSGSSGLVGYYNQITALGGDQGTDVIEKFELYREQRVTKRHLSSNGLERAAQAVCTLPESCECSECRMLHFLKLITAVKV